MKSSNSLRYCGREFTPQDLRTLEEILHEPDQYPTRAAIARAFCEALDWRKPDGKLKEMSARVALLRMHRQGRMALPAPLWGKGNGRTQPPWTPVSDPGPPVTGTRRDLQRLRLHPLHEKATSRLWNELIDRYHYLGYTPLPGAQRRYLIVNDQQILGALGLSAAAWKVAPRDHFIGWNAKQRETRLHLVVNNSRFLILPWVTVRNLASTVLALMTQGVRDDGQEVYGYKPVLLETFVERDRFQGTCYRAANWIHVGQTQGRGKLDRYNLGAKPIKDILLYPLTKTFRQELLADGITE